MTRGPQTRASAVARRPADHPVCLPLRGVPPFPRPLPAQAMSVPVFYLLINRLDKSVLVDDDQHTKLARNLAVKMTVRLLSECAGSGSSSCSPHSNSRFQTGCVCVCGGGGGVQTGRFLTA